MRCKTVFVAIAAIPFDQVVQFYTQLFAKPATVVPQVYAEFHLPGVRLGVFKPKPAHAAEFEAASSGGLSLCLEVEDLEAAIDTLTAIGARRGEVTTASHGREVYAYDPAGNRLILHQSH